MSGQLSAFVSTITDPLESLQNQFSQFISLHHDAQAQLQAQRDRLLQAGGIEEFTGDGAAAFSRVIELYTSASEKHMQVLDQARSTAGNCVTAIWDAVSTAASSSLDEGMVTHVVNNLTHDAVIQQGSNAVMAIIDDMRNTISNMLNTGGSFFGDLFSGNFSGALNDVGHELSDVGHLASDALSLLEDVGRVLGQWAQSIADAVGNFLKAIGEFLWHIVDFILGITSMIHDIQTIFSSKASLWDKLLAGGDLILNAGLDIAMIVGVGELAKGGWLIFKAGGTIFERITERDIGIDIFKVIVKQDGSLDVMKLLGATGNPAIDDVTATIRRLTADNVNVLREYAQRLIDNAGKPIEEIIPEFNELPSSVRRFLMTQPTNPFYRAYFGTALQHLTEQSLRDAGLDNLLFRVAARGGIPDIQMLLGDGTRVVYDWTTPGQAGKIVKYLAKDVSHLIEIIHPGP